MTRFLPDGLIDAQAYLEGLGVEPQVIQRWRSLFGREVKRRYVGYFGRPPRRIPRYIPDLGRRVLVYVYVERHRFLFDETYKAFVEKGRMA